MNRLFHLFRSNNRHVRDSDFGRRYGWLIERRGECLGDLEYFRWDQNGQCWHEYLVRWRRPEGDATRIEDWAESGIELRNREFSDVVVREFLSATGRTEGGVLIRGAFVPEERFRASTEANPNTRRPDTSPIAEPKGGGKPQPEGE